ncbi:MAG: tetratricopeptide repeat protein, partial [Luteolibacter sp.]
MIRFILSQLLWIAPLGAQQIIPPTNLFRDPQFVREFVGSYGFLSEVEPKVTPEEQAVLSTIRELFDQSKFREAEAELTRYIKQTAAPADPNQAPSEISAAMVFVLGNLYFQADRPDDARRAFLEAIRRFPRFRRAHTNLAYLYISQNKNYEALPMLQRAVELGENSARVYGLLGYCHLLKKNPVAAENAYRQAYLLDASSRDWKLGLAQALMAQEKYPEAASLIGTLIEENPNDRQLWLQQTNALLASERKDEAIVNLEALRLKGIADESNLNLLGNLYMDRNEPQLALLAYLAAMDKAKTIQLDRSLKSARILNDYGFPEKALDMVAKIRERSGAEISPEDQTNLLLTEVRISQTQENHTRTGELLEQLLDLNPANGEVLLEAARHKDQLARSEENEETRASLIAEAKTNYQLAARENSVAYPANLALGQMLVREKRYDEALNHLRSALELKKSESL